MTTDSLAIRGQLLCSLQPVLSHATRNGQSSNRSIPNGESLKREPRSRRRRDRERAVQAAVP
jgi:hypothetical protein